MWPLRTASRSTLHHLGLAIIAVGLTAPTPTSAADSSPVKTVKQGEAFSVSIDRTVLRDFTTRELVARFNGRDWPVFKTGSGLAILMAVDMETPPGRQEFVIERRGPRETVVVAQGSVSVEDGEFGVQSLTLPDQQVDLDSETLRRVESEQRVMVGAMETVTPKKLWDGEFVLPTEGPVQHTFGRRRIINGQPRSPHSGEDISAPQGAPVVAINDGVVRLVADHFFSGKSVVVDHGLGLYSMYFHLSDAAVRVGDHVAKAQVIGAVGATGRASGPHLHWGIRLNGARVNPLSLNPALNGLRTVAN